MLVSSPVLAIFLNHIVDINKMIIMSKTTAVEYLIEVLRVNAGIKVSKQLQEEVLQMEKKQIMEAFKEGNLYHGWALKHEPEKYYNETYKKEEK
jgi:hypothetical protein